MFIILSDANLFQEGSNYTFLYAVSLTTEMMSVRVKFTGSTGSVDCCMMGYDAPLPSREYYMYIQNHIWLGVTEKEANK